MKASTIHHQQKRRAVGRSQGGARRRAGAIAEAERVCREREAGLTKSRDRLAQLREQSFLQRIGAKPFHALTRAEKSEVIERRGLKEFERLLFAEHRR